MYSQHFHQYHLAGPHSGAPSLMIPAPSQQRGASSHQYSVPHQQGTSLIGRPIHFKDGQFAGKTIRAELHELQAAAFGRKYAKVDRRPLDPPPVAWLRLFEVDHKEIDYDNIHILGLMCTVELIPVSAPEMLAQSDSASPRSLPAAYSPPPQSPEGTYGFGSPTSMTRYSTPGSPGMLVDPASPEGGSHKATTALAGTTFVQVDSIPWNGRTCLLFTFAVNTAFFDLFSRPTGHEDQPIQADCTGASFRIYSSKEVPPLEKSTELTKHLARYGVKVNVRESERKRKKKEPSPSPSPPFTTRRVRGRGASDVGDEED
ncbi:hypothetical protein C8R44DRAFT_787200 [Mycena epipterygia]|nr:hypothetical protein C8R44DRAFT_787200 [Mycena epipterygia]